MNDHECGYCFRKCEGEQTKSGLCFECYEIQGLMNQIFLEGDEGENLIREIEKLREDIRRKGGNL